MLSSLAGERLTSQRLLSSRLEVDGNMRGSVSLYLSHDWATRHHFGLLPCDTGTLRTFGGITRIITYPGARCEILAVCVWFPSPFQRPALVGPHDTNLMLIFLPHQLLASAREREFLVLDDNNALCALYSQDVNRS